MLDQATMRSLPTGKAPPRKPTSEPKPLRESASPSASPAKTDTVPRATASTRIIRVTCHGRYPLMRRPIASARRLAAVTSIAQKAKRNPTNALSTLKIVVA